MSLRIATLVFALAGLAASGAMARSCAPGFLAFRSDEGPDFGASVITAVSEPAEMARGLMWVTEMDARQGMLFVYPREVETSFWMKNTLIPLDMIFIDGDGEIVKIHENAIPGDLTSIPSGGPVRFVLELNGGRSDEIGIEVGDQVINAWIGTGCATGEEIEVKGEADAEHQ
jgi:uncharacterized protein